MNKYAYELKMFLNNSWIISSIRYQLLMISFDTVLNVTIS